jgi:hypothetical protein
VYTVGSQSRFIEVPLGADSTDFEEESQNSVPSVPLW